MEVHLAILVRQKIITLWHDRRIYAGEVWEDQLDNNIYKSDIILLLISPDFIASDYCYCKEMELAIKGHKSNKLKIIPIIIRPVDWCDTPFSKFQALPKDGKPVTSWENQDEAWLDITKGIRITAEDFQSKKRINFSLDEIQARLSSARNEPSPIKTKSILESIITDCEKAINAQVDISRFAVIESNAFSELSQLEDNVTKRKLYRHRAIRICKEQLSQDLKNGVSLAISYADKTVDLFYDQFVKEERTLMNGIFADAKRQIQYYLENETDLNNRTLLLTQKASLLRGQSLISDPYNRQRRINQAVRCSRRAVEENPSYSQSYLSLGQSLWVKARMSWKDEEYFILMNEAEDSFLKAQNLHDPISSLVLARFYRQTYRPASAVSAFRRYLQQEDYRRRRILCESFLIGEAAIQLWYNKYDSTKEALILARDLLRETVDFGYNNARIFIALAFVEAALDATNLSELFLKKLYNSPVVSWTDIIEMAKDALESNNVNLLEKSFALGISDSSIWNALGTYTYTFLCDPDLAISFYEIGKRLNPKNYILLTNLARVLIKKGDNVSLSSAQIHIDQAAQYANQNKAFVWWRDVKEQLLGLKRKKTNTNSISLRKPSNENVNFKNIQLRFKQIMHEKDDPHRRGKLFETLFEDLLKLSFGPEVIRGSHYVKVGGERQVDASFKWQQVHYRVELKWHDRKVGPEKIDTFRTVLKTAEVRGVFVSMSGFTNEAILNAYEIGKERTIILIDGDEIQDIFEGKTRFELVLERKIDAFQASGNPYLKNSYDGPTT